MIPEVKMINHSSFSSLYAVFVFTYKYQVEAQDIEAVVNILPEVSGFNKGQPWEVELGLKLEELGEVEAEGEGQQGEDVTEESTLEIFQFVHSFYLVLHMVFFNGWRLKLNGLMN